MCLGKSLEVNLKFCNVNVMTKVHMSSSGVGGCLCIKTGKASEFQSLTKISF